MYIFYNDYFIPKVALTLFVFLEKDLLINW